MSANNLELLKRTNAPTYINYIDSAVGNLKDEQFHDFFEIMLNNITSQLNTATGKIIIQAIFSILTLEHGCAVFEEGNFIKKLPLNHPQLLDDVLDILFVLVNKIPNVFKKEVAEILRKIIPNSPRKFLTILILFAQSFNKVADPMPMLDLLFHNNEAFRREDCYEDYISVLIWLLRQYQRFKDERLIHCWSYLLDMLTVSNPNIINLIYNSLCIVFEINHEAIESQSYPSDPIICHIEHRLTRDATLSLVLRYPPPPSAGSLGVIINKLIEIAKKDKKGVLLLISLSTEKKISEELANQSKWMRYPLPEYIYTLRLFCVVIMDENNRSIIIKSHDLIIFLNNMLEVNSVGVSHAISLIIKKFNLTPDFVEKLQREGFIHKFLKSSKKETDRNFQLAILRFLDSLARVRFCEEYMEMIDYVNDLCRKSGELVLPASSVATRLARYPKCAKLFKEKGLDTYFGEFKGNAPVAKYAIKFLKILDVIKNRNLM